MRRNFKRKSFKRKSFKRKSFKRRGHKKYQTSKQKSIAFSKQQVVRMRFAHQMQLNPTASSTVTEFYRANSIADPTFTGLIGTRPKGYDQWKAFYNEYMVLGSKITVTAMPATSTVATGAGAIIITLTDDTSFSPSGTSALVNAVTDGKSRWKVYGSLTDPNPKSVRHFYSPNKFFGIKDMRDNAAEQGALFDVNPLEQAFYAITWATADPSASTSAGPWITVVIEYVCLLTGPKDIPQSTFVE